MELCLRNYTIRRSARSLAIPFLVVICLYFVLLYGAEKRHRLIKNGLPGHPKHGNPVRILNRTLSDKKSVMRKVTGTKSFHYEHIFAIDRTVKNVNCRSLFDGNETEIETTIQSQSDTTPHDLTYGEYINMTTNCSDFITTRKYITRHLTENEKEFPLAFSILMYKDLEQFERLLRAIYRPQNFYCVHVDAKSSDELYYAVARIGVCFNNVFMTTRRVKVEWGQLSVLEPEILCMELLYAKSYKWKYFINLTGQEFPILTNYQLVNALRGYNGKNNIVASRESLMSNQGEWTKRWINDTKPPHGIFPVKGSVHIAACRGFVEFVIRNQTAKDLLGWLKNTAVPDETFFPTLNYNPHLNVPGSSKASDNMTTTHERLLVRFKKWQHDHSYICKGRYARSICIFGIGDLPALANATEFFANKFRWGFQRLAYDCMEELHYNRTRDEYKGNRNPRRIALSL